MAEIGPTHNSARPPKRLLQAPEKVYEEGVDAVFRTLICKLRASKHLTKKEALMLLEDNELAIGSARRVGIFPKVHKCLKAIHELMTSKKIGHAHAWGPYGDYDEVLEALKKPDDDSLEEIVDWLIQKLASNCIIILDVTADTLLLDLLRDDSRGIARAQTIMARIAEEVLEVDPDIGEGSAEGVNDGNDGEETDASYEPVKAWEDAVTA